MNFILSKINNNPNSKLFNLNFHYKKINSYHVYYEYDFENYIYEDENYFCLINGYIRDLEVNENNLKTHFKNTLKELNENNWPLKKNITGSYTICVINKKDDSVIICNDLIGLYPLFYNTKKNNFLISSSIILCGVFSNSEYDKTGLAQKLKAMQCSTVSSRTILKDFKRLQSGEFLRLNCSNNISAKKFDNRLYQNISDDEKINKFEIGNYYKKLKKEHEIALFPWKEIYVALSGGLDSRLTLASIPNIKVNCITYGDKRDYEVKIAERIAKIKGNTTFRNFLDYNTVFPSIETIKDYNLNIESIVVTPLLQYLNTFDKKNTPILLGDLSESLPARGITLFSNRKNLIKNFVKNIFLNKKIELTVANNSQFELWKNNILKRELKKFEDEDLNFIKIQKNILLREISSDYNEIFTRIEKHNLPFVELYDELFNFYTNTRGRQLPLNNAKFHALCVSMSSNLMIATTNIHPNKRVYNKFYKKLFKYNKKFNDLYKIPIASTPLLPQYFPKFLTYLMLAIRKTIDNILIKRIIRNKNPKLKYRLFRSFNWVTVYQNKKLKETINSYFTPNHLDKLVFKDVLKKSQKRKNLNSWPIMNFYEISKSMLNMVIDSIEKFK